MLVDDHPVVRQGLVSFLELQGDLQVVAEAGTLAEARRTAAETRLDLVLLDLQLPDGNGLTLIPELLALAEPPRVLVLTSFLDEDFVREAVQRGASGFLLKHAGTGTLVDGVRAALRGELPLDPGAVRLLARPREDALAPLTAREREALALLTEGLSNRGIAGRMGVSEKTVKSHLGNVFAKLGVHDRTQAALWAKERGL
jgi:DNA-binding NarL/FixJ family response regulator